MIAMMDGEGQKSDVMEHIRQLLYLNDLMIGNEMETYPYNVIDLIENNYHLLYIRM